MLAILNWAEALAAAFALTRLPLTLTRTLSSRAMRLGVAYVIGAMAMLILVRLGFRDRPQEIWPTSIRCLQASLVLLVVDIADDRRRRSW